jgi:hypothetical protein
MLEAGIETMGTANPTYHPFIINCPCPPHPNGENMDKATIRTYLRAIKDDVKNSDMLSDEDIGLLAREDLPKVIGYLEEAIDALEAIGRCEMLVKAYDETCRILGRFGLMKAESGRANDG